VPDTPATPVDRYDVAMLDLDGVVYIGKEAIPGAAQHLQVARDRGLRLAFVTNNASRPPRAVSDLLTSLDVPATPEDVVTSAQAAARVLLDRYGEGARIALLGGEGFAEVLDDAGFDRVGVGEDAVAIVSGYGQEVPWGDIMRAAVRIRDGLPWVASNTDGTIPTPYGTAPGHGVLVDTIRRFADVEPTVAGKPSPPLLEETIHRTGARSPLMVGDRLDTDIAGGAAVGVDTLLVMTGVTGLADLLAAPPDQRPTLVAADLGGLTEPASRAHSDGDAAVLDGWRASVDDDGRVTVTGHGEPTGWWRVVAAAAWSAADQGQRVVPDGLAPPS
jgi:HAD superfamily hydrolase (TIGR01450 family)